MKIKLATVFLLAITIIGCKSTEKSNTEMTADQASESIFDVVWNMTVLEGNELETSLYNDKTIHFVLHSEGNRVSGFSGCNSFMGTYTILKGNQISFSQIASTRMACPDSKINEQDVLNVFNLADNFSISGNTLTLNKAKRAPLAIFQKSEIEKPTITEKYWKLKTLEGQEVKMAENQEREIYFILKTDENRLTGFSGCNTFSGTYTLEEGQRIHFTQIASTMKACPDVDVNESAFLKVFELTDNYTIKDDVLSLNIGRRAPLAVFEAVYFQ
ncbi:META domain-containing protein [Xanthomarina sp. F1114]|uniref:META domain-containing protein n=1 Tax=Xanthomarina sp. F1114 TaxID=2996019 RepID=UPI00225E183C|nr:META domain-containing protein [Xanthomarina sp. F1114]MCX7548261.1 META domain-containing protein [Xanthomarina sp. F1114]